MYKAKHKCIQSNNNFMVLFIVSSRLSVCVVIQYSEASSNSLVKIWLEIKCANFIENQGKFCTKYISFWLLFSQRFLPRCIVYSTYNTLNHSIWSLDYGTCLYTSVRARSCTKVVRCYAKWIWIVCMPKFRI